MLDILEGQGRGGSHKKKGQNVMRSKTALVQNYRDECAVVPCIAQKKMANEVLRYYWMLSWQLPVVAVLVHRRLGFLEILSSRVLLRLTREKMVTSLLSSSQHSAGHTDSSWTTIKRTRSFSCTFYTTLLVPKVHRLLEENRTNRSSRPRPTSRHSTNSVSVLFPQHFK